MPGARFAIVNVLKQRRIGIDTTLDEEGRNKHVTRLVELKHWAQPLAIGETRLTFHVLQATHPAEALLAYAEANHVDHVVIGARNGFRAPLAPRERLGRGRGEGGLLRHGRASAASPGAPGERHGRTGPLLMSGYCRVAPGDPLHGPYHDTEYGFPLAGDAELLERLALEIDQAGLSWATILRKRAAFHRAFEGFDPGVVARYGAKERRRLLADAGIVRNRLKVDAVIHNAGVVLALRETHGSFDAWLAAHHPRPKDEWVKLFRVDLPFHGRRDRERVPRVDRLARRRPRAVLPRRAEGREAQAPVDARPPLPGAVVWRPA